jgi:hypothetical protein
MYLGLKEMLVLRWVVVRLYKLNHPGFPNLLSSLLSYTHGSDLLYAYISLVEHDINIEKNRLGHFCQLLSMQVQPVNRVGPFDRPFTDALSYQPSIDSTFGRQT